ncbi:MAG: PrgI family protein [Candidatus Berkelbacteria bacterium]|nr:PrgI family protein [Candidatus Berkelbacteria bacterium]MCR4307873.1 PrgI family protein [Candidatus Berkelbacteria bacterium]
MEVKVPQNIDMQDKVIGPLTLVQFFYLLFGGLFIYLLNNWTSGTFLRPLFWLVAVPVGLLSFALAFIKVQDRPFIFFLGSLVRYLQRPKTRVWQKGQYQRSTHIVVKEEVKEEAPHKDFDKARVRDIVGVLDTSGTKSENQDV